ncbi:MAG: tetratricopeptide repeat protein [Candidatus Omnitrophota bacterium]|nr:tetratricopeptide repeat protein [Candidatus Omnitrophota bacterium]
MGKILGNIGVMLLSTTLFFGTAEVLVSIIKADKVRNYYDDQTLKALGDPVPKKADGEYRIYIFGGSSAYGFPVSERYSITAWLRTSFPYLLKDRNIKVINGGWPGKASYHVIEGVRAAMKYDPDLYIIYAGHNEFTASNRIYRDNKLYWFNMQMQFRSALYKYLTVRFNRLRRKMIYGSSGHPEKEYREEAIAKKVYPEIEVSSAEYAEIVSQYKSNMENVIRYAQRHGVDLVMLTMPSNLKGVPPGSSRHETELDDLALKRWEKAYAKGREFEDAGDHAKAVIAYNKAIEIDPTYAELHYRLAIALEVLGRFENAKKEYLLAKDLDARPWRAKSAVNEVIAELGREFDVPVVEIVKAFEKLSPHGIPGGSLFIDNVHPTVEAQQVITDEILGTLARRNLVARSGEWDWQAVTAARADKDNEIWKVDGSVNAYRYILRGLHLWEQGRYDQVIEDLETGLKLMPDFLESYGFIADSYWQLGESARALETYELFQRKDPKIFEFTLERYPNLEHSYSQSLDVGQALVRATKQ